MTATTLATHAQISGEMRPATALPPRALPVLVLAALLVVSLACAPADEAPSPPMTPASPPLTAHSLSFDTALAQSAVERGWYPLGPISRESLVAKWSEDLTHGVFEADPIAITPGSVLEGALGMMSFGKQVLDGDRPRFRIELEGPDGRKTVFEATGQQSFPHDTWQPYRVALPEGIGSPATLRFAIEGPEGYAALASRALPVWSAPRLLQPSSDTRPNILLVVFDTLRADHTQPYGYARETTPFLAELASRGAMVREVVATYPTTLSSHWSIFSGLLPARHGMYPGGEPAAGPTETLARHFQRAGYRTAAFTEGGFVHSIFGFDRGFDLYHNGPNIVLGDYVGGAKDTFDRARHWLDDSPQAPFFLFLQTYQVHIPYAPSERYRRMFAGDYRGRWAASYPVRASFRLNDGELALRPGELEHITNLYDAEIRELDDLFASFFKDLEESGQLDNTIVVITSDHGEDLMEHGWLHHGTTLHDPALLVPLIAIAPGRIPAGATLDCQRSQTDLMPTLLELASLPIPPHLDGASLATALQEGRCNEDRPAVSELVTPTYERHADLPMASIREKSWKLIRHLNTGRQETYDLKNDPKEKDPTATPPPTATATLNAYLETRKPTHPSSMEETPPEMKESLKALGYVE